MGGNSAGSPRSPDESQVVVTKHRGLSIPAISSVGRRDNQQAEEVAFTILIFTHSCLVLCHVSARLDQQLALSANHLSSSSVSSVATTESSSSRDSSVPTLLGLQLEPGVPVIFRAFVHLSAPAFRSHHHCSL